MTRPIRLVALFSAILVSESACPSSGSCPATRDYDSVVDAAVLSAALADGELSFDECWMMCHPPMGGTTDPTSGTGSSAGETASSGVEQAGDDAGHDSDLSCKAVEGKPDHVTCTYGVVCGRG